MPFQRQLWLAGFFKKRGIRPEKIDRKSVYGKEYWVLRERDLSHIELPPFTPKSLAGAPMPYEVQYKLSNAGDCKDWLADNIVPHFEQLNSKLSLTLNMPSATVAA